jgi:adenylate cyclase
MAAGLVSEDGHRAIGLRKEGGRHKGDPSIGLEIPLEDVSGDQRRNGSGCLIGRQTMRMTVALTARFRPGAEPWYAPMAVSRSSYTQTMNRSTEIEAVFRRLLASLLEGDHQAVGNLVSENASVRWITTAEDEWWSGHEEVTSLALARSRETLVVRYEYPRLEGFESGPVGWVAAETVGHRAGDDPFIARQTAVFQLEAGAWRIVQWHISTAAPNVEVFGHKMPGSLDKLITSLEDSDGVATDGIPSGTVTVMFTDIEDSTVISQESGDQKWTQTLEDHFAMLDHIIKRHRGNVIKRLGDGTMTVFGSARDAIDAALEAQSAVSSTELKIRIGLHTGDSLRRDGDYYGVAVNKAARIAGIAAGGEIMVSAITAELSGGQGGRFGPARTVSLKGLAGTHEILTVEAS